MREDYAGVILSLARQDDPDTAGYGIREVYAANQETPPRGPGVAVVGSSQFPELLERYARRFAEEFLAIEPPRDKPTA